MFTSNLTRLLAAVMIVIAVPGIACFGWYSMESAGSTNALVQTIVIIAYPAALISLTFLVLAFISVKRNRYQVPISALFLALSLAVVILARM
jgi:hypothetical protein